MSSSEKSQQTQHTIARWHEIVSSRDLSGLGEIIHSDAVFRSPVAHTPYQGREALTLALSTVIDVFQDFTYHREFFTDDGKNATLEFSAHVNGKQLKGVDLIKFDDDGLITEFEVMIRPVSGLMALGEEMGKRVGAKLKEYS